jgi:hypothetical protein
VEAIRDHIDDDHDGEVDRTLGAYLGMLDDFDKETAMADTAGAAAARGFDRNADGEEAPPEPRRHAHRGRTGIPPRFVGRVRDRAQNLDSDEDDEEQSDQARPPAIRGRTDDADADGPRKRREIDDLMRFEVGDDATLPPDLRRTLAAMRKFAADPAHAKARVLDSPIRPDFPTSLWADVIANAFVDFDRIYDYHFATGTEGRKAVHQLGELRLITDTSKVDRRVRTPGDWIMAWAKYHDAVVFVFPHRRQELRVYGTHIQDTFLANPNGSDRVLQYDRRVRARAADSARLRLCDVTAFFSDYQYFIHNGGPSGTSGAGRAPAKTPNPQRDSIDDICRRFNFTTCRDAGACKFKHVCIKCRKKGHSLNACGTGAGSSDGGPAAKK